MNEEIKEIKHRLQLLHAECNSKAREEDINYTLDYITNLQTIEQQYSAILSENAELENEVKYQNGEVVRLNNIINEYRNHLIKKMNEFVFYNGDLTEIYEEEFDYLDKLKELKEGGK